MFPKSQSLLRIAANVVRCGKQRDYAENKKPRAPPLERRCENKRFQGFAEKKKQLFTFVGQQAFGSILALNA
jgi:hypothetical protein